MGQRKRKVPADDGGAEESTHGHGPSSSKKVLKSDDVDVVDLTVKKNDDAAGAAALEVNLEVVKVPMSQMTSEDLRSMYVSQLWDQQASMELTSQIKGPQGQIFEEADQIQEFAKSVEGQRSGVKMDQSKRKGQSDTDDGGGKCKKVKYDEIDLPVEVEKDESPFAAPAESASEIKPGLLNPTKVNTSTTLTDGLDLNKKVLKSDDVDVVDLTVEKNDDESPTAAAELEVNELNPFLLNPVVTVLTIGDLKRSRVECTLWDQQASLELQKSTSQIKDQRLTEAGQIQKQEFTKSSEGSSNKAFLSHENEMRSTSLKVTASSQTPRFFQQSQQQMLMNSNNQNTQQLADYLAQLIKDKKQLGNFPNLFLHVERILDEEINRVRSNLFHLSGIKHYLPNGLGPISILTEKIYLPVKEHPDYNFVGRIVGPRGMTIKKLEHETGCKIMIRGKGSMKDQKKEELNRGRINWEHLNDEIHVLITVEDIENRGKLKLQRAVNEVNKLLIPTERDDDLKKRQLMELARINRTYRDPNETRNSVVAANADQFQMVSPQVPLSHNFRRAPTSLDFYGAPLIMSPHHRLNNNLSQAIGRGIRPQATGHSLHYSSPYATADNYDNLYSTYLSLAEYL